MDKKRKAIDKPVAAAKKAADRRNGRKPAGADKTIHVSAETHRRLRALGQMGDTLDTVIVRLLDGLKAAKATKRAAGRATPKGVR